VIESPIWNEHRAHQYPEDHANAELIVTAVNNHEALVQLVRRAWAEHEGGDKWSLRDRDAWMEQARPLLLALKVIV
jgi:hypothetical protein